MEQLMEDLRESGVDTNFAETSTEEDARFDNVGLTADQCCAMV